jgi:hypothetical protein
MVEAINLINNSNRKSEISPMRNKILLMTN